jgi:hypothetical protein
MFYIKYTSRKGYTEKTTPRFTKREAIKHLEDLGFYVAPFHKPSKLPSIFFNDADGVTARIYKEGE